MAAEFETLNLGLNTKRRFTIDGDHNKVLEIDVQDMAIMSRIKPAMEKINNVKTHWDGLQEIDPASISEEDAIKLEQALAQSEKEMREGIDFLFDTNVCEVCAGNSSVFSPVNGKLKYDIIISGLSALYEDTIKAEMSKFDIGKVTQRATRNTHPAVK